jgi:3-methylcrotonyl-CoA carboxylase alpha subunit
LVTEKEDYLKAIRKLAIANRGEVAVRIIRACEELGIESILLHSEPDQNTRAYRLATKSVCIGPATSSQSYLNIQANVQGALAAGADAVHPGFGFLSENADFAQACLDAGLIFVGPTPDAIQKMGDKVTARALVEKAGVPLVPGYQGDDQSDIVLKKEASRIGYPLMIKATAGGGGRGLKVAYQESEFQLQLESARREALNAFGSDQVFLERYIENGKHIEFQVFGDTKGNVIHLNERECSVQRRHQKIVEEAQSPSLNDHLRKKMSECAVKAAQAVSYVGAGTVEFLLKGDQFYFLEMNTRLQVEHPVTEEIHGVDLVKAQIQVAQGYTLPWKQEDIVPKGHSIECRIYAEDPYMNGVPSTGKILSLLWPEGKGRRYEYGFDPGDEVTSFYDSMIAKIIVHDENREMCIQKALRVLSDTVIFGVKTNIDYLKEILNHSEFRNGTMSTAFISKNFPEGLKAKESSKDELAFYELAKQSLSDSSTVSQSDAPLKGAFQIAWRNV